MVGFYYETWSGVEVNLVLLGGGGGGAGVTNGVMEYRL